MNRVNVITLGVADIERSRAFYEGLGFKAASFSNESFVAFQTPGIVFCLFPVQALADDAKVKLEGSGTIALAHNVAEKSAVQKVLDHAVSLGGHITKPAEDVFWGGHSGYFQDPDGHLWEVAWNPHWPLDDNGLLKLPE